MNVSDPADTFSHILMYQVVYEDSTLETVTVPYVPGYLASREALHYYNKIQKVKGTEFCPQVRWFG